MTLAGDENVFGWVPAGDAQQFAAQEIDAVAGAREELNSDKLSNEQRKKLSNGSWMLRNAKR